MKDKYHRIRTLHGSADVFAEEAHAILAERDALLESLSRVVNGCDFESEDEWLEWRNNAVDLIESARATES